MKTYQELLRRFQQDTQDFALDDKEIEEAFYVPRKEEQTAMVNAASAGLVNFFQQFSTLPPKEKAEALALENGGLALIIAAKHDYPDIVTLLLQEEAIQAIVHTECQVGSLVAGIYNEGTQITGIEISNNASIEGLPTLNFCQFKISEMFPQDTHSYGQYAYYMAYFRANTECRKLLEAFAPKYDVQEFDEETESADQKSDGETEELRDRQRCWGASFDFENDDELLEFLAEHGTSLADFKKNGETKELEERGYTDCIKCLQRQFLALYMKYFQNKSLFKKRLVETACQSLLDKADKIANILLPFTNPETILFKQSVRDPSTEILISMKEYMVFANIKRLVETFATDLELAIQIADIKEEECSPELRSDLLLFAKVALSVPPVKECDLSGLNETQRKRKLSDR